MIGKLPRGPLNAMDEATITQQLEGFFRSEKLDAPERTRVMRMIPAVIKYFYGAAAIVGKTDRKGPSDAERMALLAMKATVILVDKTRTMDGLDGEYPRRESNT